MSRLKGTLVLVALVALGGFVGLWIRRQNSFPELQPAPHRHPADSPAPQTSAAEVSTRPSPPPQANPKATLLVRLRCSGKPVPGVEFIVREESTHEQNKFMTDPGGAHQITALPAGNYLVSVDHPDYVRTGAHRKVEADKAHEIVIELDRGARLVGKVTDMSGRPLEAVHVFFVNGEGVPLGPQLETNTDASGEYLIQGLPVGIYDARYRCTGYRAGRRQNLAVSGQGQEFRVDMALAEGRSMTGKVVRDDGTPIAGATVVGTNEEVSTCRSDEQGAFSLRGLGDGPVASFASAAGYGPVYLRNLAPGSSNVEFRLSKAAEVVGRVQPVPGRFSVTMSRLEQDLGRYVPMYTRSFEGEDFRVTELPAGRYRLEVEAPGYETQDLPELEVSAGQTLTGIQIRLRKTS